MTITKNENNRKYRGLLGNTVIFAIGSLGSKAVLFFLVPLYTSILSQEEYGTAELVFTIGQLVLPFVSMTIFDALLRFGLMPQNKRENVFKCSMLVYLLGSVLAILLTPAYSLYSPIAEWSWYITAYIIVSFLSNETLIYLKVKEENKKYALLSILQAILLVLFNLMFLVVENLGIQGYLLSTIISMGIVAILAFVFGKMWHDLRNAVFNLRLLKEMAIYALPLIINNVSWWIIHSSDKVMIEWLIGVSYVGLYTAAAKIPSLMNVATTIFSQAWGISSIKEFDSTRDKTFFSNVFKMYSLLMFGLCLAIVCVIKPFMAVYVAEEFYDSWRYVPTLLLSAVFSGFSSYCGSVYGAIKKSTNVMWTTVLSGIINIVVNYILILKVGTIGAAIGTLVAYVTITIVRMIDIHRYFAIDYSVRQLFFLSVLAVLECISVTLEIYPMIVSGFCIFLVFFVYRKMLLKIITEIGKTFLHIKNKTNL